MSISKKCYLLLLLSATLTLTSITALNSNTNLVLAEEEKTSSRNNSESSSQVRSFTFPPNGSPRQKKSAGARGEVLQAILTQINRIDDEAIYPDFTYAEHPSFWLSFNDPRSQKTTNARAKFILIDEANKTTVDETYFEITDSGIFEFQLPKNKPGLEVDSTYRWQLAIVHGQNNKVWVSEEGLIIRQEMPDNIKTQLEASSDMEKINIYGQNGIWYDTVTQIARLHRLNPSDEKITQTWQDLLVHEEVKLDDLKNRPQISCCLERSSIVNQ